MIVPFRSEGWPGLVARELAVEGAARLDFSGERP
jgi:hypothetical protein